MTGRGRAGLVVYRAVSDALGKGAFLIVTVLAARRLDADAFGLFAVGSTLGWLAAVAADFGVQLHVARETARAPARAPQLLQRWLSRRLWTSLLVLAVAAAGIVLVRGADGGGLALTLFAIGYLAAGLVEFLNYFYRGLSRSDLESTLTLVQRAAMVVLAAAALWWRADVTLLAALLVVPGVAAFAWSVPRARRLANDAARAPSGDAGPGPAATEGRFWREVAPIGAGIVLSALYFRIDIFLIERWSGIDAAGAYNAAFRIVDAMRLLPAAVLAVFLPALVRARSRETLLRVSLGLAAAGAAAAAALVPLSGWLLPAIYGPPFAAAVPAFRLLLVAFPLMALNYALTTQLVAWNRHRAFALLCAAALVVNVGANARLIPALSIVGAAWATLLTEVFLTAGCLVALAPVRQMVPDASAAATP